MLPRLCTIALLVTVASCVASCLGCRYEVTNTSSPETAKLKTEVAKLQEELKSLKPAPSKLTAEKPTKPTAAEKPTTAARPLSVAEELERLDALRTKGILSAEEFEAAKQAALKGKPEAGPAGSLTMQEFNEQLRVVNGLYQKNTINNLERDSKKQQLLQKTIRCTDLKTDMELAQALYSESIINNLDFDALKKKLLEESGK